MGTTTTESKVCTVCEQVKPFSEFYSDKRRLDGRRSECKKCANKQNRASYRKNKVTATATKRVYYQQNKQWLNELSAKYYRENPHVHWESSYKRRALRHGHVPYVESFTSDELIARYGDKCFHCGGPFEQLDHYPVPVADNGVHTLDNCKPSCTDCNAFQGAAFASRRDK